MEAPQTRTARGASRLVGPVCVLVVSGPDQGKRYELESGSAIIGTQGDCALVLNDPTVSRRHVMLALTEKGVQVTDLESRNGTWVNGLPITETGVVLGARVRLGETELQLLTLASPLAGSAEEDGELYGLIGKSRIMQLLRSALRRAAPGDATVLIQGETGTGKDLFARALHNASGRTGPLVAVDCASLAPELIASELFGHVEGAFSGAVSNRKGAVETAAGGTLFLDEIAELSISLQPALLRLIETKSIRAVGGESTRRIDVRIVAATHRDLALAVRAGKFREDLFHRLTGICFILPPLRERPEDIPELSQRLLTDLGLPTDLGEDALQALAQHDWPGNVRELRNTLQRLVLLGEPLPPRSAELGRPGTATAEGELDLTFAEAREAMHLRFERAYLLNLLRRSDGNVSEAARRGSIARGYLYRLLKRHGLV